MMDPSRVRQNWNRIRDAVAETAVSAGRPAESVTIVGVSKYVDSPTTAALLSAGCVDLGESRPQSLWQKAAWFDQQNDPAARPRWHLVGHLQRNKVRRTLPLVHLIHSVDSQRLLEEIATESAGMGRTTRVLLEVNVSGEQAKTGLSPEAAERLLRQTPALPHVQVVGLMAMAGWATVGDQARRQFSWLRELRDRWQQEQGLPLPELSMGMSNDFAEAIREGATIVRIGTALFDS